MKKQIIVFVASLSLLLTLVAQPRSYVTSAATAEIKEITKTERVGDYAENCIRTDGILYEAHSEIGKKSLNKDALMQKIEVGATDDVTVQFELKDKFYESAAYREITGKREGYADPYAYLKDLRAACNSFYKARISEMSQDSLFSDNDYYSCFYDITDLVFNSENPYDTIKSFTELDNIENVVVSEKQETVSAEMHNGTFYSETVNTINASQCINSSSRLLTGSGIKVGVSEWDMKLVKINCPNHSNFTLYPKLGTGKFRCGEHPHFVMSAITSMAPDVQLYGADYTNEGINWLIEQNVSIINCSWGHRDTLGQYCSREKYFDTLALDNSVIFIFAAGNVTEENPDNKLTCPESAYNVITVGATDSNGTDIADYSCYKTDTTIGKPNLVANGSPHLIGTGVENSLHLKSGTSFAAPLVTGAVALLQEGGMGFEFDSAAALLAASANIKKIKNPAGSSYAGFDKKAGAGMLDVDRLINSSHEVYFANSSVPSNKVVKEVDIWLYAGLPVKACAAWYAQPTDGQLNPKITDYDLRLLDSSGNTVASSASAGNNQELLSYTAPSEGAYKIQLIMYSTSLNSLLERGTIAYSFDIDALNG